MPFLTNFKEKEVLNLSVCSFFVCYMIASSFVNLFWWFFILSEMIDLLKSTTNITNNGRKINLKNGEENFVLCMVKETVLFFIAHSKTSQDKVQSTRNKIRQCLAQCAIVHTYHRYNFYNLFFVSFISRFLYLIFYFYSVF